ncbi:SDR family oxidoreductase [Mesorhizobium sp. AD1-1]|uniref:SDR family NAD(P)-dependent oxidoreductase n=1 Tax=Mesorhizobium sp. AD1-1 TaxID=2876621 RepID=UPI001CCCCD65|nr:SDR family oxidoreductase [Mesorhizobium sp. AD1-1]MBZ9719192.1 SDR family oxidoreductase [Mesorhizobium sp. AD1-1]
MQRSDLAGKSSLVTGASGGLGHHFGRLLARQGVMVTLAARRVEALENVCAEIRKLGGSARALRLDVADTAAVDAAFAEAPPFDIVINNAGVSLPGPALETSEAEWDSTIDVNLKGSFFVAKAAASAMLKAGRGGSIVNVASILGMRVAGSVSAYASSKAGLIQLTKSLALEWARHGIRVNALCPGYIETDLNREFFATSAGMALINRIPQRRLGQLEDLDAALLLLASDAGRYITGATLAVDGGHLVSSL